MTAELLWVLPGGFALLDWYAVARGDRRLETWAKPATLVALMLTAAGLGAADSTEGRWLLVALLCGLVGDVFLLGDSTARFQAGLGAFLVGHLAYAWSFVTLGLDRPAWAALGVAVALVALGVARGVLPATHRAEGFALSVPVAVYMLVISAMAVLAWATGDVVVGVGATIFVASDTTLAVNRFVRPVPRAQLLVMITYHVGQALIVLGLLT